MSAYKYLFMCKWYSLKVITKLLFLWTKLHEATNQICVKLHIVSSTVKSVLLVDSEF